MAVRLTLGRSSLMAVFAVLALAAMAGAGAVLGAVYGGSSYLNVTTPQADREYYTTNGFNLNMTTAYPSGMANCTGYIWNGSTYAVAMINTSTSNNTFSNTTPVVQAANGDVLRWAVVRCMNTTNYYWTNQSEVAGRTNFRVNEWAAASVSFTDSITNGTVYKAMPKLNISLSDTASSCTAYFYNSTEGLSTWASLNTMSNTSGTNARWANSSALTEYTRTDFKNASAITYKCADAVGNVSWLNTTVFMNDSRLIFIGLDSTAPTFNADKFVLANSTVSNGYGNYINATFNTTDNNPYTCGAFGIFEDGTEFYKAGTHFGTAGLDCRAYIYPNDLLSEGNVTVTATATDAAGNAGNSTTHMSYVVYSLYANRTAPIVTFQNATLQQIGAWADTITSVTIFDNTVGYKNFTTHTVGLAANGGIQLNATMNVTLVLASQDTKLIRMWNATPQLWRDNTTRVGSPGWNLIGFPLGRKEVNASMSFFVSIATAGNQVQNETMQNVTHFGIINRTTGYACTSYFMKRSYSCINGLNTSSVYIPTGTPAYVQFNNGYNGTVNVSSRP